MGWHELYGRAIELREALRRGRPRAPLVRLLPASEIKARLQCDGITDATARKWTLHQLAGLRREVDGDASWLRLCELVRRAADPWNADDWPLGFDALLCCVPLCTLVSFECKRCCVGQQQGGMSCAHPQSAFGTIWGRIHDRDRDGLRDHLARLERLLA